MSRALRPPLTARLRSRTSVLVGAILAVLPLLAGGCALGGSGEARAAVPTPVTRAARTAAAASTPTAIPRLVTAVIFADPASGRPVFPTPPPSCAVSATNAERPDLGPTIGEPPLWMASPALAGLLGADSPPRGEHHANGDVLRLQLSARCAYDIDFVSSL